MPLADSVLTKLEQLRQQPEPVRRRWLWASSIGLTLLIVGLWILNARLIAWSNTVPASAELTVKQERSVTWGEQWQEVWLKITLGWHTVLDSFTTK